MPLKRKAHTDVPPAESVSSPEELIAQLDADDADTRRGAALSLASLGRGADALAARFARETDRSVREAIGGALMRCASTDSALAIAPFLGSDQASVRNEARELLHALPGAERVAEVLLSSVDPDVRMFAVEILAQRAGSAGAPRIAQLLAAEADVNVLAHAVEQLGFIGTEDYEPALYALEQRMPDEEFLGFAIADARERIAGRRGQIRGTADRTD